MSRMAYHYRIITVSIAMFGALADGCKSEGGHGGTTGAATSGAATADGVSSGGPSRPLTPSLTPTSSASGGGGITYAGSAKVSGKLPQAVIERVVTESFPRFRACYELGLKDNPALVGQVTVRFVIGRDGAVPSVGDGGSDLPDKTVVNCVVRSFGSLTFPAPDGGIVSVTYPLSFSPGT